MPPKAEAGASNDGFLVACVKSAKNRLEPDFDAVASATGLSKGGAANKFRAIMKQFEEGGATFGESGTAADKAPKRKAAAKKEKKAPKSEVKIEDDGDEDSSEEEKPAAKKAKTKPAPKKKGTATAKDKKKAALVSTTGSEEENEEDGQATRAGDDEV